jgi:twitching motility protein PilT
MTADNGLQAAAAEAAAATAPPPAPSLPNIAGPTRPVISAAFAPGPASAPGAGTVGVRAEASSEGGAVNVNQLLLELIKHGGSDLHLSAGLPPAARIHGEMTPLPGYQTLTGPEIYAGLTRLLTEAQKERYDSKRELDFAHTIPDVGRFRVNMLQQKGNAGAVFRAIPKEILPLEKLGLPPVLYNFAAMARGLVLVTGPTGSGKSTTLASLIDRANRTRAGHIITVEDPIEFIHSHRLSVVNQREVGVDTDSFNDALKHILRQDPDIILIGELRDLETISTALTAAETGHLVFATLHTQSAQDTINRIIDVFPGDQQSQIRSQLAATLRGVICQTLVRRSDSEGRAAAAEIMAVTPAIANMIRKDEIHQIPSALQSGAELGMQTLNQSLAELVARGMVEREIAAEVATDLTDLDNLIKGKREEVRRETFSSASSSL